MASSHITISVNIAWLIALKLYDSYSTISQLPSHSSSLRSSLHIVFHFSDRLISSPRSIHFSSCYHLCSYSLIRNDNATSFMFTYDLYFWTFPPFVRHKREVSKLECSTDQVRWGPNLTPEKFWYTV